MQPLKGASIKGQEDELVPAHCFPPSRNPKFIVPCIWSNLSLITGDEVKYNQSCREGKPEVVISPPGSGTQMLQ